MIGEIVTIRQILNEDLTINSYEIIIDCKDRPNLKLGKVEIKQ